MGAYWENLRLINRNVRFFLLAVAVHGFVFFGIYSLLLNLYLLRLGYQAEFIGLVNGLGPLMLAVFSLPAGMVSRRWGSRRVMLWSYFTLAVFFSLLPHSEWLPEAYRQSWIAGSYALTWISASFVIVNFGPYLMAWTTKQERNHAFAIQGAALPVAGFLGSLLGGALPGFFASLINMNLDSPIPYRNALFVAGIIELLAVFAIKQTTEIEKTTETTSNQPTGFMTPPYRLMLLFALVALLSVAGEWTMRIYFNVYLDSVLMVPTTLIGMLSAGALLMGLSAFLSPQAAARWGKYRIVLIGSLSVMVAFLPLILIAHWLAVGLGYMILVGVLSLSNPIFGVFSQSVVEPHWHTSISSAISMAIGIGIATTSLGGGYVIANYGFQTLFFLGATAGLMGAVVIWLFLPRETAVVALPVSGTMD